MRRRLALALLTTSLSFYAVAESEENKVSSIFGYSSYAEALHELSSQEGAIVSEEQGWLVILNKKKLEGWSFPPESHPAFPSVIRKRVVSNSKGTFLEAEVSCGASKSVCDQFVAEHTQSQGTRN